MKRMDEIYQKAAELADRPYTIKAFQDKTTDDEIIYIALNPELEGCLSQGTTLDDAIKNLADARIDYIASLLEDCLPVPDPKPVHVITETSAVSTLNIEYQYSKPVPEIQQTFSIRHSRALEENNSPIIIGINYGD